MDARELVELIAADMVNKLMRSEGELWVKRNSKGHYNCKVKYGEVSSDGI